MEVSNTPASRCGLNNKINDPNTFILYTVKEVVGINHGCVEGVIQTLA
jgi:hypothetical protein